MSITALGIAVAYLLILIVGAIGALFTMIWLFRETQGGTTSTKYETVKDLPKAARRPLEPEHSEDKAA